MRRLLHIFFILKFNILVLLAYVTIPFINRKSKDNSQKRILALPYTPKGWPGGEDRIAAWQNYLNGFNNLYQIHWAWEKPEIESYYNYIKANDWQKIYKTYNSILLKRYKLLFKLNFYDIIWVQRAWVPLFPFKNAVFEKLVSKFHKKVIYDFYDADYIHNKTLVNKTAQYAYKVSVASMHLYNYFSAINSETYFLRYAIKTDNFKNRQRKSDNQILIGWMGSPTNAKRVFEIKTVLQRIEKDYPQVNFSFTCRQMPNLGLKNIVINQWGINNFNYEQWIANLDIGIVPYINPTETVKAKIAMKGLEFMSNSIPMVISPYIHSDKLIHGNSCFIASTIDEWYLYLTQLIENHDNRKCMGFAAKKVFNEYHSFNSVLTSLKSLLEIN